MCDDNLPCTKKMSGVDPFADQLNKQQQSYVVTLASVSCENMTETRIY